MRGLPFDRYNSYILKYDRLMVYIVPLKSWITVVCATYFVNRESASFHELTSVSAWPRVNAGSEACEYPGFLCHDEIDASTGKS